MLASTCHLTFRTFLFLYVSPVSKFPATIVYIKAVSSSQFSMAFSCGIFYIITSSTSIPASFTSFATFFYEIFHSRFGPRGMIESLIGRLIFFSTVFVSLSTLADRDFIPHQLSRSSFMRCFSSSFDYF